MKTISALLLVSLAIRASAQETTDRERALLDRIVKLEQRLAAVEARAGIAPVSPDPQPRPSASDTRAVAAIADSPSLPGFATGTTLNVFVDGYYGYNFNHPLGRVNLLRAYDVLSNSFSLNQAGIMIERLPDPQAGRPFGMRLDLQFGQATEALQGGAQNEPRPQVYRNVFQAYGTYVAPVGGGLSVDFGKWASSFGIENNYTKDQINYSRSYYFNFLPFYHFGLRTNYNINSKLSVQYWLVNGLNQSEDFNGFKSNAFLVTLKPARNISWNINYYIGRDHRDVAVDLNPGIPPLPAQPGLSIAPLRTLRGRGHIIDSYVTWNATQKLLVAAELDHMVSRLDSNSPPSRVSGGAAYLKYQLGRVFSLAGRFEYLNDHGGLFSGATQVLKESTMTATYQFVDGFQVRGEFRRDFSGRPFFLTDTPGLLKREQDTATLGLIWWFGGKQGPW